MSRPARALAPIAVAGALAAPQAHADPPRAPVAGPHSYAIVVGSNEGGAGQAPLQYAEGDARSVAEVLREIGHFDSADVHVLLHPAAAQVLATIDDVASKVQANAARGEPSELVYYYSGHARATAVNLGGDELPLASLRAKLTALPTTLTIVVLDACQSGAFARVKGAEPAADFTYNVSRLTQKGLAVMASSSQEELSQESDEIRGSYFTHHLVTALRGAGDTDRDGRVSLDEAYRYAFRRTLASTARTQVGGQHVTLETDLAGQGEVPLTYPAESRAQLELPSGLEGRVLLQHVPSGSVIAEVQKAPGAALRLAVVAGSYDAVVGQPSGVVECRVTLADGQVTSVDTSTCTPVTPDRTQSKGGQERPLREIDRWEFEASVGAIQRLTSNLTDRLQTFGYTDNASLLVPAIKASVGAARAIVPHVSAFLQVGTLSSDSYQRQIGSSTDTVTFTSYGAAAYIRTSMLIGPMFGLYGQAGVGVSLGVENFQTQQTGVPPSSTSLYASYLLSGAVGASLRFRRVPLTVFAQGGYDTAPAIHDLIGDTHDSGGFSVVLGIRLRTGDAP